MRVLPDTNLLVRATLTRQGLARQILSLIGETGRHKLLLSDHVLKEVASVLSRARIRRRLPWTEIQVLAYLQYLMRTGEMVAAVPLDSPIADPKDQAVIEAAIAGRADVLCTLDRHFYTPDVLDFCADTAFGS